MGRINELRLIARVAQMYHAEKKRQAEIAEAAPLPSVDVFADAAGHHDGVDRLKVCEWRRQVQRADVLRHWPHGQCRDEVIRHGDADALAFIEWRQAVGLPDLTPAPAVTAPT